MHRRVERESRNAIQFHKAFSNDMMGRKDVKVVYKREKLNICVNDRFFLYPLDFDQEVGLLTCDVPEAAQTPFTSWT